MSLEAFIKSTFDAMKSMIEEREKELHNFGNTLSNDRVNALTRECEAAREMINEHGSLWGSDRASELHRRNDSCLQKLKSLKN